MFAAIRRRATFANICSFLALSIVLSMGTAYAANTIRSEDIVNGQVKNVDLGANSVKSPKIADGQVLQADLGANSVDGSKLLDGSITAGDLGSSSVGSDEIASDAVNATEIADGSIDSGEIVDNSLTFNDLASGSVGSSEIADSSIAGTDIASSTITGLDIASSTITSGDIATDTITTSDLLGADVFGAISLSAGAVSVGRCENFSISTPGTATDQTVMISARDPLPEGVILYGVSVLSAGTAVMAVCNFTGTTFPALNSFPIRVVSFG